MREPIPAKDLFVATFVVDILLNGLVAGMCKELGIANLLDSLVPNQSETRKISFDRCLNAA